MRNIKKFIVILTIAVLSVTLILLVLDYFNCFTCIGFDVKLLNLEFWSIYIAVIASLLGGAMTLFGVLITVNRQREEDYQETRRLVMPMINISYGGVYESKYKYIQLDANFTEESKRRNRKDIRNTAVITIKFTNIGMRELKNLHICSIQSPFMQSCFESHKLFPIIYSKDFACLNIHIYEKGVYDNDRDIVMGNTLVSGISFVCYFQDCLDNWYKQDLQLNLFHRLEKNIDINEKALHISLRDASVVTAPAEIKEDMLPWKMNPQSIIHSY